MPTLIYCRRDFRDIAVSCWLTGFRSVRWTNATEHIASRFHQHVRVMITGEACCPGESMRSITKRRGRPRGDGEAFGRGLRTRWNPACLEFHRTSRPVRTASFAQVRQPVYTSSVARWKNYQVELADLFAVLPQASGPCASVTP